MIVQLGKGTRFILGLCCLLAIGCGRRENRAAAALAEDATFLSASEAEALTDRSADAFREQARHWGADRLIELSHEFLTAVYLDSTATETSTLRPFQDLVVEALATVNRCPEYQAEAGFFEALPAREARRILTLARQQDEVFMAPGLSVSERTEQLTAIHEDLMAAGYELAVARGYSYRGTLATRSGHADLAREMFTAGLAYARDHHLRSARCNALASLIMQGFAEGRTDSTSVLLARGLRLARAARLGAHTGRLLALSGYQAFGAGHYAAAVRFFEDGVAACRNFGSPAKGLAYLGTLMRMYAVMESWTMVDQVAQRADVLLRDARQSGADDAISALQLIRQHEMRNRSLLARGKIDQAHAAYGRLWDQIMAQPFEEASFVANYWIMGLLDHDRPDLARDALARAETYAHESGVRHLAMRLPFWRARIYFQEGAIDSARASLSAFAATGLQASRWTADLEIPYHVLHARLLAVDNVPAAGAALADGMAVLRGNLADASAGAGAFLDLNRARGLRWAAHDILGRDAAAGYGLELVWRQLLGVAGPTGTQEGAAPTDLEDAARKGASQAEQRLADLGAVHLLYQVRDTAVIRWLAGATVQCDTLAIPTATLRRLVATAQTLMSTDPGDPEAGLDPALRDVLAELARALLPTTLRDPAKGVWPDLLLISGESFLAQIPFAPLDVGTGRQYVPLAARVDLSWVRNPSVVRRLAVGGTGLVLADPRIDPALQRRYRTLAPLPGIEKELRAVRRLLAPEVLQGEAATEAAVSAAAPSAALIYFMGHVLHNPEAPFLTSIPLTPPHGPHPAAAAALDLADIRGGDYRRCNLVVLAGCGSGQSFVDGLVTAPSLGDAFLDAGAGAALQTFWQIDDSQSVFQPAEVLRLWREEGLSLPAALGRVRRQAMQGPQGMRHPFSWGAWTLKLSGLPR